MDLLHLLVFTAFPTTQYASYSGAGASAAHHDYYYDDDDDVYSFEVLEMTNDDKRSVENETTIEILSTPVDNQSKRNINSNGHSVSFGIQSYIHNNNDDDDQFSIPSPPVGLAVANTTSTYSIASSLSAASSVPSSRPFRRSSSVPVESTKVVRFSESNEIFQVMNRHDIKPSEKRQAWYRRSELKQQQHLDRYDDEEDDEDEDNDQGHYDEENNDTENTKCTENHQHHGVDGSVCYSGGDVRCKSSNKSLSSTKDSQVAGFPIHRYHQGIDDEKLLTAATKDEFLECQRIFHRMKAVASVLEEQDRQRRQNGGVRRLIDADKIARTYRRHTSRSRQSLFISTLWACQQNHKKKKKKKKHLMAMTTMVNMEDNTVTPSSHNNTTLQTIQTANKVVFQSTSTIC
jgi:hypothetical protein